MQTRVKMNVYKKKPSTSGTNCSIVGCKSRGSKDPELSFHSFPNKPWERERRKMWIAAVRRKPVDGKPWEPSKNAKICSRHFEGGQKSGDPRKTSYNPTIFPEVYRRIIVPTNFHREKRLEFREKRLEMPSNVPPQVEEDTGGLAEDTESTPFFFVDINSHNVRGKTTQTDPDYTNYETDISFFHCWQNPSTCEVATQTCIVIKNYKQNVKKTSVIAPKSIAKSDIKTCETQLIRSGFLGFRDIKTDSDMKQLGGVTLSFFEVLLEFLKPGTNGQPRFYRKLYPRDRLLLFLMKMKLGFTFGALGIIFDSCEQTVSRIFHSVLNTIYENIKTRVFWPSREVVKTKMPVAFENHPNCRVIIDLTEIRTDIPYADEQRMLMYSLDKSAFIVKFLIGISPSGFISFVSKGYGGKSTDRFIFNDSKFIDLVEPGDEIMTNKDLPLIKEELLKRQCDLVRPSFAFDSQFDREEVLRGRSIAESPRMYIERAIQKIKIYRIFEHINNDLIPKIDEIMYVACALVNCQEQISSNEDNVK